MIKDLLRCARRAVSYDAVRPAREDDRLGIELSNHLHRHVLIGVNFAVNVQFTQAARDQLRHLTAEVDDKKGVLRAHARGV